jgi:hypothetical protein
MLHKIKFLVPTIIVSLTLIGCARNNVTGIQTVESEQAAKNSTICSVSFKNGLTKTFSSLNLITGVLTTPFLLADGHIKIKGSEINGYSNEKYEALSQESFYTKVQSKVAKKVLPGFAIKTITGAFNLYSLEFYNNGNISTKYFLQEGDEGSINLVDAALLNKHFAMPSSNKLSKKNSRAVDGKTLIALVEKLNKSSSISKSQN